MYNIATSSPYQKQIQHRHQQQDPCLSGACSKNSKIATTSSPSDAVLARFRRSPPRSTRMASCDAQSGATAQRTAGSKQHEEEALVCFALRAEQRWLPGRPWQSTAGPAPLSSIIKLTSGDTSHFLPSHLVKDDTSKKEELVNTSVNYLLILTHYRQNGQSWYVLFSFTLRLWGRGLVGVHGVSRFERD